MLLPGFSVTTPCAFIWFLDGNENKVDISMVNGWEFFPSECPWGAPTDGRCYGNSRYYRTIMASFFSQISFLPFLLVNLYLQIDARQCAPQRNLNGNKI